MNSTDNLKSNVHQNSIASRWALISGATAGIGLATAERLAKEGCNLILIGRRDERLSQIKNQLNSSFPNVKIQVHVVDVAQKKSVDQFVEKQKDVLNNISILVNSAGLAKGVAKMQLADVQDWDLMIDTNIKGLLYLTRAILPFMVANQKGDIINLGSVAGRWVYPGGGIYCATKFAVRAISEGLRMDLNGTNIRVCNIEPGMVNTEFSKVRLGSQEDADRVYLGMTPLAANDIAETISWVLKRPAHVNIQELVIFPTDQASVSLVNRKG
jgi:3-hydroxy acid dehydrogenase / malonic semialdehyde reductase